MRYFTISFSNADTQGEAFLDLGSGGGLNIFLAAKRIGPRGKCIGVDMNDKMLELARIQGGGGNKILDRGGGGRGGGVPTLNTIPNYLT